jgi:hypothetical protein
MRVPVDCESGRRAGVSAEDLPQHIDCGKCAIVSAIRDSVVERFKVTSDTRDTAQRSTEKMCTTPFKGHHYENHK